MAGKISTTNEIRITNVNPDVKRDLVYIAKKINGGDLSNFLKPHLREIRNGFAEEIKRFRAMDQKDESQQP